MLVGSSPSGADTVEVGLGRNSFQTGVGETVGLAAISERMSPPRDELPG